MLDSMTIQFFNRASFQKILQAKRMIFWTKTQRR